MMSYKVLRAFNVTCFLGFAICGLCVWAISGLDPMPEQTALFLICTMMAFAFMLFLELVVFAALVVWLGFIELMELIQDSRNSRRVRQ